MLSTRDTRVERMDAAQHDAARLAYNLDQLATVNRWLGGARVILRELTALNAGTDCVLVDVGTGGGDIPRAVVQAFAARRVNVRLHAVDVQVPIARMARDRCRDTREIDVSVGSGLALPFVNAAADVVMCSATIHHFSDDDAVALIREMARVARRAVIVNDLERNMLNYLGARALAETLWRRDWYARHDGPISVLRAFRRRELLALGRRAGLRDVRVRRHVPFRLALVGTPPSA